MPDKLSEDDFLKRVNITSPNIKVLGEYINSKTPIEVECLKCGRKWSTAPANLFMGKGCINCFNYEKRGKSRTKTHQEFIKEIYNISPLIEIQGEYIDTHHKIQWQCKGCGEIHYSKCGDLLHGHWCRNCRKKVPRSHKTTEEFMEQVNNKNTCWNVVGEYINNKTKVKIQCKYCGYIHESLPQNILHNSCGCPICSDGISYPNKFSRSFLKQLPITNVIYEYSPDWAKPLRYDNYFEYNGQAYILEMDGGFHYQNNALSHKSLEEINSTDRHKDELALSHNIKVIRIDCKKSKYEYIMDNIRQSELSCIFDLSDIDWNLCNKYACSSLVYEVYDYYNKIHTPNVTKWQTIENVAREYNINPFTVYHYLQKIRQINQNNTT